MGSSELNKFPLAIGFPEMMLALYYQLSDMLNDVFHETSWFCGPILEYWL